jgi:hypothetical protein
MARIVPWRGSFRDRFPLSHRWRDSWMADHAQAERCVDKDLDQREPTERRGTLILRPDNRPLHQDLALSFHPR